MVNKKKISSLKKEYIEALKEINKQILQSRSEAISSINFSLNKRNWLIGKIIVEKQTAYKWGSNFLDNLAQDIEKMYPGIEGFSRTNIFRMKAFFEAYQNNPTAVGLLESEAIFKIPWGHNAVLLEKVKVAQERIWYAQKSIENGWSRSMLDTFIKSNLYKREGKAITNFKKTLPAPQSDMAQQSLKDPYIFDFLTLRDDHLEHDLEQGLIDHVQKLLLEMGKGFALVGRQYHLEIKNKDFYIDLLFYHFKLKCFVVVELKSREFDPKDAGQINFYLSAVDDLVRSPEDKPTIGLLLCKTKDNFMAEYALRNLSSPIGVAEYETAMLKKLPKGLKSSLPTIEEIEAEFEKQTEEIKIKKKVKKKAK